MSRLLLVPAEPPTHIEALLLNSSAVYLKWQAPKLKSQNGVLTQYFVIVRGVDIRENASRILTNVTLEASPTPSLMLANLTWGVTYTVSIASGNNAGLGPFSSPAPLRLDPRTKKLDQSLGGGRRYVLDVDDEGDFMTEAWFILLLGGLLIVMMISFVGMIFAKRRHMLMKQGTPLTVLTGSRANTQNRAGKMGTLPYNPHDYWCDPEAVLWRQTMQPSAEGKGSTSIPDYGPVGQQNNRYDTHTGHRAAAMKRIAIDYKEFAPGAEEYAEVSSFSNNSASEYGARPLSPAPYATTMVADNGQLNTRFASGHEQRYPRLMVAANRNAEVILGKKNNGTYKSNKDPDFYNNGGVDGERAIAGQEKDCAAANEEQHQSMRTCNRNIESLYNNQPSANQFKVSRLMNVRTKFSDLAPQQTNTSQFCSNNSDRSSGCRGKLVDRDGDGAEAHVINLYENKLSHLVDDEQDGGGSGVEAEGQGSCELRLRIDESSPDTSVSSSAASNETAPITDSPVMSVKKVRKKRSSTAQRMAKPEKV